MKTTVELSDPLMKEVKYIAQEENTALGKVMEQALQEYVAKKKGKKNEPLKENHFKGNGFADPAFDGNWEKIRAAIYGHGD